MWYISKNNFQNLNSFKCLRKRSNCDHCYYGHPIKLKTKDINNKTFAEALRAELSPFDLREKEGVKIGGGYVPRYIGYRYLRNLVGQKH